MNKGINVSYKEKSWLEKLYLEAKRRWVDVEIDIFKIHKSKVDVYMRIRGERVKLIVYRDGRVWVASRLQGLNLALKRMVQRILEKEGLVK